MQKKLQKKSKYSGWDLNQDGEISDEEISAAKEIRETETKLRKNLAQLRMARYTLIGMGVFTAAQFVIPIPRVEALAEISSLFYISGAGIVGTYMGTTAWMEIIMLQFLAPLASLATSFMENKIEQTKAKGAVAKAEAEAKASVMKTAAEHDSKWELIMAQSTQSSYKDEIITVIVLIPVILVFIPGMEDIVKQGFERLNELPQWYQNVLYVTILAGLGLKGLDKFRKK